MTSAKTATVRLYVTAVSVLTAAVALVGAVVRLLGASVALLAALVEKATPARAARADARASGPWDVAPLRLVPPCPAVPTPPVGPSPAARLDSALRGLGFAPRDVARVVTQLGPRVERERIETLIPVALRALASPALAS